MPHPCIGRKAICITMQWFRSGDRGTIIHCFGGFRWNTAGLQSWSSTLLRIPAISFSHFTIILYVSLLLLVLDLSAKLGTLGSMFSRSAAVGSTEYFSVSSYEEVMCTGLRWNKRTMQEKITSIGIRSVMILGVSGLYHDNTHRKPQWSIMLFSCMPQHKFLHIVPPLVTWGGYAVIWHQTNHYIRIPPWQLNQNWTFDLAITLLNTLYMHRLSKLPLVNWM